MSEIVLDGITKRYQDGTTAVRSLDLSIADGELMVLVGPSGCGKTTALRMVAGLEEITDGTILIDGQPVNDMEPRDRDIAMVFQSYALYPHLTVRDNMAFSLKYRKTPKAGDPPPGGRGRPHPGAVRVAGPQAAAAVRRAAAAGRDGPGHRPPAARVPDG